jgi:hypothetical protein
MDKNVHAQNVKSVISATDTYSQVETNILCGVTL